MNILKWPLAELAQLFTKVAAWNAYTVKLKYHIELNIE